MVASITLIRFRINVASGAGNTIKLDAFKNMVLPALLNNEKTRQWLVTVFNDGVTEFCNTDGEHDKLNLSFFWQNWWAGQYPNHNEFEYKEFRVYTLVGAESEGTRPKTWQ